MSDGLGFSNFANGGHGTFVAGMISAKVAFSFNTASTFFRAVQAYAPGAIVAPNRIPMLGSAPLSSIYALRVFGPTGGAPYSRILQAIDRAKDHDAFAAMFKEVRAFFGRFTDQALAQSDFLIDRLVERM